MQLKAPHYITVAVLALLAAAPVIIKSLPAQYVGIATAVTGILGTLFVQKATDGKGAS